MWKCEHSICCFATYLYVTILIRNMQRTKNAMDTTLRTAERSFLLQFYSATAIPYFLCLLSLPCVLLCGISGPFITLFYVNGIVKIQMCCVQNY